MWYCLPAKGEGFGTLLFYVIYYFVLYLFYVLVYQTLCGVGHKAQRGLNSNLERFSCTCAPKRYMTKFVTGIRIIAHGDVCDQKNEHKQCWFLCRYKVEMRSATGVSPGPCEELSNGNNDKRAQCHPTGIWQHHDRPQSHGSDIKICK